MIFPTGSPEHAAERTTVLDNLAYGVLETKSMDDERELDNPIYGAPDEIESPVDERYEAPNFDIVYSSMDT